ncbi:MAG: hypothetical protein COA78_28165 [Blastopirellula sp.]|nr:MAG: hypothetical protein COA78_28165 [Blastopirellula sp.]
MYSSFALDLKAARRKSGLSQLDCGHLLGVDQRRISVLETGKSPPTILEICSLSLIYGRTFESLFGSVFCGSRKKLETRLASLPNNGKSWLRNFNRQHAINRIAKRLDDNRRCDG